MFRDEKEIYTNITVYLGTRVSCGPLISIPSNVQFLPCKGEILEIGMNEYVVVQIVHSFIASTHYIEFYVEEVNNDVSE